MASKNKSLQIKIKNKTFEVLAQELSNDGKLFIKFNAKLSNNYSLEELNKKKPLKIYILAALKRDT